MSLQPDTIVFTIDANYVSGTPEAEYTIAQTTLNKLRYEREGSHTLLVQDTLDIYRTYPTKSGSFNGAMKTALKFTVQKEVENALGQPVLLPGIAEVSFSVPVGYPDAAINELIGLVHGHLKVNFADVKHLVKSGHLR